MTDDLIYTGSRVSDPSLPRVKHRDAEGEFETAGTRPETWKERAEQQARELTRLRPLVAILMDLDRCEHGRHERDNCFGCGGPSKGNPLVGDNAYTQSSSRGEISIVPRQLGFNLGRGPIVVPARGASHEPSAWDAQRG